MHIKKWIIFILIGLLPVLIVSLPDISSAAATPVSVSILPPIQFPPEDFSVTGVRTSLFWGRHREVYGFDLGVFGNVTEQRFVGLAFSGLFNYTRGKTTIVGLQFAGLTNINIKKSHITGIQFATLANINKAEVTISGLQIALANLSTHSTVYGMQAGLYNRAWTVYGFQIGLINVCNNLRGFQIGLLNFNKDGIFPIAPIFNFGF